MIEFSTLSPGQPPGPASSQVSPPEALQLDVRGPAVRGDGGDQGKELPGRSHIFPSMDVRFKYNREDQRTTLAIVEDLTLLCRQKKSGQFQPPEFLPASSCVLCGDGGSTCFGICCMGPKSLPMSSVYKSVTPPSSIPGLLGSPSTSLTVIVKTSNRKLKLKCFKPSLFKWNNQQGRQPQPSLPIQSSAGFNPQSSSKMMKAKAPVVQDGKYDVNYPALQSPQ